MKKNYLISLLLVLAALTSKAQDQSQLSVNITNYKVDSVSGTLVLNSVTEKTKHIRFTKHDNTFKATIPLEHATFIELFDGKNLIQGVVEADDNLSLTYNYNDPAGSMKATGKGSGKFNLLLENATATTLLAKHKAIVESDPQKIDSYFTKIDSIESVLLKKLDKLMFSVSSSSYNLLKGEIKGMALQQRYLGVEQLLKANLETAKGSKVGTLSENTSKAINSIEVFSDSYYLSPSYLQSVFYILSKEYEAMCVSKKTSKCLEQGYEYFNEKLKGQLAIPVKTMLLVSEMEKDVNQDEIFSLITKTFQGNSTSEFKPYLEKEFAQFRIGKKAPELAIEDALGNKILLSAFKGKVVYLNFWFSGHTGCQNLFSKLKVVTEQFADNDNVVFLSVSIDSKELFKRSSKYYGLKGIQGFTEGKGMEHSAITAYKVQSFPTSFIIDRKGNFYSTLPPDSPLELISVLNEAMKEQLVMGKLNEQKC